MKKDFSKIKLMVCDFDGVMTDNKVIVKEDGSEAVICNRSDGLGIETLKNFGIGVMVLSKERSKVVAARCNKLKIGCIFGSDDKLRSLREEVKKRNLSLEQVCFIGNDINDIECLKAACIGIAVADSHEKVLEIADIVTKRKGGEGAIREVCDMLLFYSKRK